MYLYIQYPVLKCQNLGFSQYLVTKALCPTTANVVGCKMYTQLLIYFAKNPQGAQADACGQVVACEHNTHHF